MSISGTGSTSTGGCLGTEFPRPMGVPGHGGPKGSASPTTSVAPKPWTFDEDPDAGGPTQQSTSTGPNLYGGRIDIKA